MSSASSPLQHDEARHHLIPQLELLEEAHRFGEERERAERPRQLRAHRPPRRQRRRPQPAPPRRRAPRRRRRRRRRFRRAGAAAAGAVAVDAGGGELFASVAFGDSEVAAEERVAGGRGGAQVVEQGLQLHEGAVAAARRVAVDSHAEAERLCLCRPAPRRRHRRGDVRLHLDQRRLVRRPRRPQPRALREHRELLRRPQPRRRRPFTLVRQIDRAKHVAAIAVDARRQAAVIVGAGVGGAVAVGGALRGGRARAATRAPRASS